MNDHFFAEATCRVARATMVTFTLGYLFDCAFLHTALGTVPLSHPMFAAFAAAIWGVLFATRRRPREWLGSVALIVGITAGLATLAVSDRMLAGSSVRWMPFEPQRLGALMLALLAPPRVWLGMFCIAEVTAVPLLEWAMWSPAVRARHALATPWMVVAYGLVAVVIYTYQLTRRSLERRVAVAQAEVASGDRFARLAILVRDLANTPLQTIELTVALIRRRQTCEPTLLSRLQRATERLVAIGRALEEDSIDVRRRRSA